MDRWDGESGTRIGSVIGCDLATEREVGSRMRRMRGPFPLAERDFDALAWAAFAELRRDRLSSGMDDPLWDLAVTITSPLAAEGGSL